MYALVQANFAHIANVVFMAEFPDPIPRFDSAKMGDGYANIKMLRKTIEEFSISAEQICGIGGGKFCPTVSIYIINTSRFFRLNLFRCFHFFGNI